MAGTEDLSFAYLESHPTDAARVLERIAPQNVAALLSDIPARLAAPVLRIMLPLHVARCLETLADDTIAGMLRAMGPQAGVAVLHYIPESRRHTLLTQLPTALSMAYRLLLGYPEDTVGAWMDPRILALSADTPAETALERLRDPADENNTLIYVIDPDQRLLGTVELTDVLRAPSDLPLRRIMHKVSSTLPARTAIRAVERHIGWNDHQVLAVVEREDRLVGALDRGVLARALQRTQRSESAGGYGDLLADVAGSYWQGVSGLIQLIVALLPVAPPHPDRISRER